MRPSGSHCYIATTTAVGGKKLSLSRMLSLKAILLSYTLLMLYTLVSPLGNEGTMHN